MANIDYDDFKGKLGVGRVHSGSLKKGQSVGLGRPGEDMKLGKISELFVFDNLGRKVIIFAELGCRYDVSKQRGVWNVGTNSNSLLT